MLYCARGRMRRDGRVADQIEIRRDHSRWCANLAEAWPNESQRRLRWHRALLPEICRRSVLPHSPTSFDAIEPATDSPGDRSLAVARAAYRHDLI